MADDIGKNDIINATGNISNSINQSTESVSSAIDGLSSQTAASIQGVTQALNKEGIKLSALQEQVENDLNNMGDYFQSVISYLVEINNNILSIMTNQSSGKAALEEKPVKENNTENKSSKEETQSEAININTSATTPQEIGTATGLANITGTGFSVLANILNGMSAGILSGFDQLTQVLIASKIPVTQSKQEKTEEPKKENGETAKPQLADFFTQLAGPLNTIASGLLLLTVAVTVLGTMGINPVFLQGMVMFGAMMFMTFFTLKKISQFYTEEMVPIMSQETAGNPGNILNIIQGLSMLVISINASILLSMATIQLVQANLGTLCLGLLVVFGSVVISLVALSALSTMGSEELKSTGPVMQLMNNFTKLIITITSIFLICALAWPFIESGFGAAIAIVTFTELAIGGLVFMAARLAKVDVAILNAFNSLLITMIVIIGVLSLLTIVLGLIPAPIIQQGLFHVTLLTGLSLALIGMAVYGIKAIQKTPADQIYAFMAVLIASIACITVLSILTIILAQQDPASILMALGCMVVLSTIPIVLFKIMSNIGKQADALPQALLGIGISALLTIAVAGLANLIISMLGIFTIAQVVTTVVAVSAVAVLMIAMSGFTILMGSLATPIIAAAPMATAGILIVSAMSLLVASAASAIIALLGNLNPIQLMQTMLAITITAVSFVGIGVSILLLSVMALPLMVASIFAEHSIRIISSFIKTMSIEIQSLEEATVVPLEEAYIQSLQNTIRGLLGIAKLMFPLAALSPLILISTTPALLTIGATTLIVSTLKASLNSISEGLNTENNPFQSLQKSVQSLGNLVKTINSLPMLNPLQIINAFAAMSAAKSLESKISKLGSAEKVQKVQYLTASLARLANQQQSLNGLASAIQNVAKATETLHQAQASNTNTMNKGIERMIGKNDASIQNVYQSKSSTSIQNNGADMSKIKSALEEMVGLLKEIKNASWENIDQSQQNYQSTNNAMPLTSLANI